DIFSQLLLRATLRTTTVYRPHHGSRTHAAATKGFRSRLIAQRMQHAGKPAWMGRYTDHLKINLNYTYWPQKSSHPRGLFELCRPDLRVGMIGNWRSYRK